MFSTKVDRHKFGNVLNDFFSLKLIQFKTFEDWKRFNFCWISRDKLA
jgi:hypothetical protein